MHNMGEERESGKFSLIHDYDDCYLIYKISMNVEVSVFDMGTTPLCFHFWSIRTS